MYGANRTNEHRVFGLPDSSVENFKLANEPSGQPELKVNIDEIRAIVEADL